MRKNALNPIAQQLADNYSDEAAEQKIRHAAKSARAAVQPRDPETGRFVAIMTAATCDDEEPVKFLNGEGDETFDLEDVVADSNAVRMDDCGGYELVPVTRVTRTDQLNRPESVYSFEHLLTDMEDIADEQDLDSWCETHRHLCYPPPKRLVVGFHQPNSKFGPHIDREPWQRRPRLTTRPTVATA